jgi:hypothetical protein
MLKEGQIFNSFKELCVFMGWINKIKTISTGSKKKLQKDLSQICNWERLVGTNKIRIIEIYDKKKKRIDGRSINSKYINLIEEILINKVSGIENGFYSIRSIGSILGVVNYKFYEDRKYYSKLAFENCIDRYLISIYLIHSKGEINKIIKRAMRSLIKNNVIDAEEGIIIYSTEDGYRMALQEEVKIIKIVEKNALNLLGCKNKGLLNIKNLSEKFKKIVNDDLKNSGYDYIEFYFLGYWIKSFNNDITNEEYDIDNSIEKEELRNLIMERLRNYGINLNKNAIKKEYEILTFGEPMLEGVFSNCGFVKKWNWLTNYFFREE